ncbi:MAG: response regulator transcription factor [Haliea sp.]
MATDAHRRVRIKGPIHKMTDNTPHPGALLPVPVLIVEDEPLMQQRLVRVLQGLGYETDAIEVKGNLQDTRSYVQDQPVAMALVDIGLPDGSGIELIEELRADDPALSILVISAWSTEDIIISALRAGATGYVLKERDDLEISLSIRSVLRGGAPIDPFIARRILELLPPPQATPSRTNQDEPVNLSTRETEILHLVAEGLTNREIAERLFISRYTAECHIKRIYKKLAVTSRTRAVNKARQHGLLP